MKTTLLFKKWMVFTCLLLTGSLYSGNLLLAQEAPVSCDNCSEITCDPNDALPAGPHDVIYAGRWVNEVDGTCKTYFFYCVINDGNSDGNDISHTTFGDDLCENTCLESDVNGAILGQWNSSNGVLTLDGICPHSYTYNDPTTGICGLKNDEGSDGECYNSELYNGENKKIARFYICVNGNVA